jgi:ATP-dependent DNA helicase PIF1
LINIPEKFSWIDLSDPTFYSALDNCINGTQNLNIIGMAGCGKSVLLSLVYNLLTNQNKNVVVLTPTGVSSYNLQIKDVPSVTIHSFFRLPPVSVYTSSMIDIRDDLYEMMNEIDVLIIDEVSFINASLFDFIHELLLNYRSKKEKHLPRFILFSDPLQLENPLNKKDADLKKYFHEVYDDKVNYYNSYAFKDYGYKVIQLNKIFRQSDVTYQSIFNRVREGRQTKEDLDILNQQFISEEDYYGQHEIFLYLATTNQQVDLVNKSYFEINENRPRLYEAIVTGKVDWSNKKYLHERVFLKKDCNIMCIKNDPDGQYINGTIAKVIRCNPETVEAITEHGNNIEVKRFEIKEYEYSYESFTKQMSINECGSINLIGCILGYAITIHRSQSLSLDNYYIDLDRGLFANGQLYVAISRAKNFKNVGLSRPISSKDIIVSEEALNFLSSS